jgi:hypothetical protein
MRNGSKLKIAPNPPSIRRTPLPLPENGHEAIPLDDLDEILRSRTVMSETELTAVVLWIAHTYVFDRFKHTPRLFVTSVRPGCGKSELLRLTARLSHGGEKFEAGSSLAAIRDFRMEGGGTCVIDQLDGIGKIGSEDFKLMNFFCSSTEVGAKIGIKEKQVAGGREQFVTVNREVGYPVALGKIGDMPNEALMSRTITIRMRPETKAERASQMEARMGPLPDLRDKLGAWTKEIQPIYIPSPEETESRVEDMWQPLLNVARLGGPEWEKRALGALIDIHSDEDRDDPEAVELLRRVYDLTHGLASDTISGPDLDRLLQGGSIILKSEATQRGSLLVSLGVRTYKSGDQRKYRLEDIKEAWGRWRPAGAE